MRTYGESIEVRTADPAASSDPVGPADGPQPPAQFLWRGRLYLVREVLAHWVELGTWWTARAPRTSSPAPVAGTGYAAAPEAPRSVAVDVGAVEREVWRVEAASGRTAQVGVYDLVRDVPARTSAAASPASAPSSGSPGPTGPPPRWRLARALD